MATVNFKRISSSANIDSVPIQDGNFIVTGDGKSYIDYGEDRIGTSGTIDNAMSDSSTNAVENNVIKEYVDDSVSALDYELLTSGNWVYKKYNNGYIEMFYKKQQSISITNLYSGATEYYFEQTAISYPIELTELYNITTGLQFQDNLARININRSSLTSVSYYISSNKSQQNVSGIVFLNITGKWK